MFGGNEKKSFKFISLLILLTAFCLNAAAQENIQYSQGKVEEGMNNTLSIPLMSYKGRGLNLPVTLNYSSNVWRIDNINTVNNNQFSAYQSMTQAIYAEHSTAGWKTSLDLPKIEFPKSTDTYYSTGGMYCHVCSSGATQYRIARLYVHMPDGSTHELRKGDFPHTGGIDVAGNFYAVDGSRLRYNGVDADTGTLYLPDGTRYVLDAGDAQVIDRNGNTIYYDASDREWTDSIGRVIDMPFPANPQAQDYTYNLPGLAGVNNGLQTYTFKWRELEDVLTPDPTTSTAPPLRYIASHYLPYPSSLPTAPNGNNYPQPQDDDYNHLFQYDATVDASVYTMVVGKDQAAGQLFNPVVLAEVVLPDGRSYKFSYNVYGEIDKIIYPTGSYEKYQIQQISNSWGLNVPYDQANRGVTNRKLSIDGSGNDIQEWKYSKGWIGFGPWGGQCDLYKVIAPDNTRTEIYKLKIDAPMHGPPLYREYWDFNYVDPLNGATVEKRYYSTSSDGLGGTLLRREMTEYQRTVSTVMTLANGWVIYSYRNIRPTKAVSVFFEGSGSALAQTTTFSYDTTYQMTTGVDQTQANTYDFAVISNTSSTDTAQSGTISQISSGALAKYTETTYQNDSTYRDANILGLPTVVKTKDGAGTIVSQSETVYDESGYSPAVGRGLPTSSKVWDSTKGAVTNTSAYLVTHATFDTYGNQTIATDAKGNSTTTTYDSTHHAFPISMTTAAPDQNGGTNGSTTGFTTSVTYDSSTPPLGLPVATTDINGQTTTMEYNDALLRPTKVTAPNGHQTITEYGAGTGTQSTRYVKVKTQIDADNWSETYSWYDGIGRSYKSESVDAQGNVFVLTCYDNMGRVEKISNPFRNVSSPTCSSSLEWTVNDYDDLGRATTVTSPDSAVFQTAYGLSTSGVIGTTKIITDQAGKKRKGITDALGRMTRVTEDPDGQNLSTDYVFDTLGNLRKTTQGEQERFFRYDSLGRLLYAKQVEQDANSNFSGTGYADEITSNNQWSVKYTYDDNGNITTKTDARNITITATYDHLNRLILRDYSDSTMPDVSLYYDGKGLAQTPACPNDPTKTCANGKTTKVNNSVSENRYTSFDKMGRILSSQQITDGQTYAFGYSYNLSGALIEETYPSGRVVKNTVNQDGELSQVQSKKNANNGFWTYANGFAYNAAGALEKMRLGNGRWETYQYNNRLQIKQIGLGTTNAVQDLLKLEFGYDTTSTTNNHDNNGSMLWQKITVPTVGSSSGFVATQTYTYDSLNRIQSATETILSSQTWKQTFSYDRYGNRRFDTSGNNTTTLGNCSTAVCNPTISTGNNRFSSGQGYSYNANGDLTQDAANQRFGYDAENHQKEFFASTNNTSTPDATYHYDGEGRRVKKISSTETTVFVYDGGGQLAAEYATALATAPKVSYLTNDHLGSPRVITDETGAVTKRQDYSAFGEETVTSQRTSGLKYTVSDELRRDYTGYEKDDESGLDYAQARYYNPNHGRFTSVDPLTASAAIRNPQTFNRYSYVLNSPYKFTDPLGLIPESDSSQMAQYRGTHCNIGRCVGNVAPSSVEVPPPQPPPDPGSDANAAAAAPAAAAPTAASEGGNAVMSEVADNSVDTSAFQCNSATGTSGDDDATVALLLQIIIADINKQVGVGATTATVTVTRGNAHIMAFLTEQARYLLEIGLNWDNKDKNPFFGWSRAQINEHLEYMAESGSKDFFKRGRNLIYGRALNPSGEPTGRPIKLILSQEYLRNLFLGVFRKSLQTGFNMRQGENY